MKLSARNQITGNIKEIKEGVVNASILLETQSGDIITSIITLGAVKDLGLTVGAEATAIIKATEVIIGIGDLKLSARNQLECEVLDVKEGAVNGIVTLKTNGGNIITSTITMAGVEELELSTGINVKAIIKASSVMIAV